MYLFKCIASELYLSACVFDQQAGLTLPNSPVEAVRTKAMTALSLERPSQNVLTAVA